jgi:agmatinase
MKSDRIYAGIETPQATWENSAVILQSIPYDGTSTWGKGADNGFQAFMDASDNMEIYDIETNSEVYEKGVFIIPAIKEASSPEAVYQAVLESTTKLLETNKFLTFFGGEHSISIGVIEAFRNKYKNLTVLQIDAHADLRKDYMGTPYNHACAVHQASQTTNLIQVGIRSMDSTELPYLKRENVFFAEEMYGQTAWMDESIAKMEHNDVYLTIDLDAFDPAIMPATGTPEPGGLDWNTAIRYLRKVFKSKNVVGFDLVELAPIDGNRAPEFLAAKLYYKLLSYKYYG